MRVTSKGQVTIPIEIREKLGLLPDSEVEFVLEGNTVCVRKMPDQKRRGRALVQHLTGRIRGRLSTDQIMALTRGRK